MNELLSYLSVDKQRVKCLFTSMLLRQQSKHLAIGDSPPTADVEIVMVFSDFSGFAYIYITKITSSLLPSVTTLRNRNG